MNDNNTSQPSSQNSEKDRTQNTFATIKQMLQEDKGTPQKEQSFSVSQILSSLPKDPLISQKQHQARGRVVDTFIQGGKAGAVKQIFTENIQGVSKQPQSKPVQQSSFLKTVEKVVKGPLGKLEETHKYQANARIGQAFLTGGKKGLASQLAQEIGNEIKSSIPQKSNHPLDKIAPQIVKAVGGKLRNIHPSLDQNNNLRIDGPKGAIFENGNFTKGVPKAIQDKFMQIPKQVQNAKSHAATRSQQRSQERER
jgi:hypothetical protein